MQPLAIAEAPVATAAAWWAAVVLFLAVALSGVDRQILMVLLEPVRGDLGLTDRELGALVGLAYGLCNSIAMLPLSLLADRFNRVWIIAGGVAVWSVMTAYCGFAHSYWELFAGRMGLGLGEAALLPAAFSLIGERFGTSQRPVAVALLNTGLPVGLGLSFLVGGPLFQWFTGQAAPHLFGRDLHPWQTTMVVIGGCGLLLAGLILTIEEPRRRSGGARNHAMAKLSAGDWHAFRANALPFLAMFTLACSFYNIFACGVLAWTASLLGRKFGWTPGHTGLVVGIGMVAMGIVGAQAGGWLTARRSIREGRDESVRVMTWAAIASTLPAVVGPLLPSALATALTLSLVPLFLFLVAAVAPTPVINTSPGPLRARVYAVFSFINGMAGVAFGPSIYAFATDRLFGGPAHLAVSLSTVSAVMLAASVVTFWLSHRLLANAQETAHEAG